MNIRETIIKELDTYPGGVDAIHIQTTASKTLEEGERLPRLKDICEELERLHSEGCAERLDDVPGANLSSTRIYAKPGTYPES